jgi:hypothetical protein
MSIFALRRDAAFDSETTGLLGSAFEAAWERMKTDRGLADDGRAAVVRELLAKHIIELGRRGERDHDRLVEGALEYLARSTTLRDGAPAICAPKADGG